jgi:hypothetical protein
MLQPYSRPRGIHKAALVVADAGQPLIRQVAEIANGFL